MQILSQAAWRILRQLAAEMALMKADRAVVEKVKTYIQTETPSAQELLEWLEAFEQDGYLGARSGQTWHQHRLAKALVQTVLGMTKNDVSFTNLSLAWVARLMAYYESQRSEARELLKNQSLLIRKPDPNAKPPRVYRDSRSSHRSSQPSEELDKAEVDPFANEFMRKLRGDD